MTEITRNYIHHCIDCGLHRTAVSEVVPLPDGAWRCGPCHKRSLRRAALDKRDAIWRREQTNHTIRCPDCDGRGKAMSQGLFTPCASCGGFGSVLVNEAQLKTFSPSGNSPQKTELLTKDGHRQTEV